MNSWSVAPEDAKLLDQVPQSLRAVNGIPEPEQAASRERAASLTLDALADLLLPDGVRTSPLGPGWSRDIDLHLRAWPEPARLKALGWIPLDPLLHRLGVPSKGEWAIIQGGQVLAGLDLHLGPPPHPVTSLINRCWRRGEVRVREMLEARALLRAGHTLPAEEPAIRIAARVEAGLGGQALTRFRDGPALGAPSPLPGRWIRRRWANLKLRSMLRPRLVVAVSGVDGSGKSTLSCLVARNLDRAGVPVSYIWARPGRTLRFLEILARASKRLLGQDSAPGIHQVAAGMPTDSLASRRGVVGWTWAMLVTLSYLVDVSWQYLRTHGVLLCDRHLLDALVQLDFAYGGVNLRLHRAVVRRVLPKPLLSVYLDVPAEVAVARKPREPWDVFVGEYPIRRQLEIYEAHFGEVRNLRRLDGERPADELAAVVTRWLAEL